MGIKRVAMLDLKLAILNWCLTWNWLFLIEMKLLHTAGDESKISKSQRPVQHPVKTAVNKQPCQTSRQKNKHLGSDATSEIFWTDCCWVDWLICSKAFQYFNRINQVREQSRGNFTVFVLILLKCQRGDTGQNPKHAPFCMKGVTTHTSLHQIGPNLASNW